MDGLSGLGLPAGWASATLGELCDVIGGITVDAKRGGPGHVEVPYLRVANVQRGRLDLSKMRTILVPQAKLDALTLQHGDVLLNEGGDRDKVGRGWVWEDQLPQCVFQNHVFRARVRDDVICPYFLSLYLNEFGRAYFLTGAKQTTNLASISLSAVKGAPVVVPPRAEQARIVAAVDALFEEVEAGEAALGRAREGLTQFRASLLHAACTGALTADWRAANPTNETADDLLTSALDLRKRLWPGRYEAPVSIAADMPMLPVGWRWATLDQLAVLPARNGISVKGNAEPPGVAALRLDAMQGDGLDFTRRRYIDIPANKAADLAIREGDFLVSRANGSLMLMGRASVAGKPPVPTVFPDTMIRFRLASAPLARWAAIAWRSAFAREHLERRAKTSAGIWKISQDDMRSAPIPLPPSHEIAAILDALDAAKLEDDALPASGFADALRQSILHAAFTGRLVPQDPADEPAAALLARLRAAPAAARRPRARGTTTQPDLIETPA
ncbi:restriction endonuclease subunit S [Siccirubricoccus phaeus]|uniref:restriction endonuclease subunit S n=1 Tax=Siccirubricoccus phaeus TaxID=2595053 RepID=UPI0011F26B20|nr:restriction endonuclease subunit S [Siccirubricoccus phaeus]